MAAYKISAVTNDLPPAMVDRSERRTIVLLRVFSHVLEKLGVLQIGYKIHSQNASSLCDVENVATARFLGQEVRCTNSNCATRLAAQDAEDEGRNVLCQVDLRAAPQSGAGLTLAGGRLCLGGAAK